MNNPFSLQNQRVLLLGSYLIFAASGAGAQSGTDNSLPVDSAYHLVWHDEFDTDGAPDARHWNYEEGYVRNEEDQWYQLENAVCQDGFLVIEARKERKPNPDYRPKSNHWKENREYIEYTSSSLLTRGLHAWQYGRFEIRAKIDTHPGMWPAFWTVGQNGTWPASGEIDIMEYYRGMLLANAAWAGANDKAEWDDSRKKVESLGDPKWSEKFHVWRMDWDERVIRLYVDDLLLNTIAVTETINQRGTIKNPMMQPHYLIVNLAVGGANGGDPSRTKFPRKYVIDYVRVYQY